MATKSWLAASAISFVASAKPTRRCAVLRDAGFNTVFLDGNASAALIQEAADLGFWIVPQLKALSDESHVATTDGLDKEISRFTDNDALLFWHLSSTLSFEQVTLMGRAVQTSCAAPTPVGPSPPTSGTACCPTRASSTSSASIAGPL